MELRQVFIHNLKKYRKENGFSQMKLAEICASSTNYIGAIEIGNRFPSVEMIQKMANALGVEPYKFFVEETDDGESAKTPQLLRAQKEILIQKIQSSVAELINQPL